MTRLLAHADPRRWAGERRRARPRLHTFGGEGNPAPGSDHIFRETEVYDARTDRWKKLAPSDADADADATPRHRERWGHRGAGR